MERLEGPRTLNNSQTVFSYTKSDIYRYVKVPPKAQDPAYPQVNEDDCCEEAILEAADSCVEMVRVVCRVGAEATREEIEAAHELIRAAIALLKAVGSAEAGRANLAAPRLRHPPGSVREWKLPAGAGAAAR